MADQPVAMNKVGVDAAMLKCLFTAACGHNTREHLIHFSNMCLDWAEQAEKHIGLQYKKIEDITQALDRVHLYIDATDEELRELGKTRAEVLQEARQLRALITP